VIGAAVGEVVSLLTTPQDVTTFTAEHRTGPADMSSQLATALAATMADVSPPSACGIRAEEMRSADTRFLLELAFSAVVAIERDQDPAAVAALILPVEIEGDQRETIADQLAAGEIDRAAVAVEEALGDDLAKLVVHGLVEEITGVLANENEADYLSSFLSTYNFAANISATGCD
jgi:hypothetical protein